MGYTPSFTPQYENGWEDLPSETSPITATALNAYDDAIENIEDYLASDESQANLADAYDETATYEAGDYVIYGGDLYKCLEDIDTPEEWDSTKWESCLITDEMATSGGTNVIANPSGEATETLTKLQVENTIYGISGGGGNANIWTGTQAELEEVFDELAEGTQINITDDEQEVVEGGTIYSEEEQCIGLWTDNRPLYQRTYVYEHSETLTSNTNMFELDDAVEVKYVEGYIKSPERVYPLPYANGNKSTDVIVMPTDGVNYLTLVVIGDSWSSSYSPIVTTIKYTKSTDAPLDVVIGKSTMYIASSDCYSTEEKEIGCWKDGKPLYQRSYDLGSDLTCASQSWTYTNIDASNIDFIVKQSVQASNGTLWDALEVNADVASGASTKTIGILNTRSNTITVRHITIQYTKTTDTAGSGSYTPASGKAVHYSTDEQVIGTWIDGSTIYRKVFNFTNPTAGSNSIQHNISNFGRLINVYGNFSRQDGYDEPIPMPTANDTFVVSLVDFTSTTCTLKIGSVYAGTYALTNVSVVVEYTKATS